jgi:hypothetical protein
LDSRRYPATAQLEASQVELTVARYDIVRTIKTMSAKRSKTAQ